MGSDWNGRDTPVLEAFFYPERSGFIAVELAGLH